MLIADRPHDDGVGFGPADLILPPTEPIVIIPPPEKLP